MFVCVRGNSHYSGLCDLWRLINKKSTEGNNQSQILKFMRKGVSTWNINLFLALWYQPTPMCLKAKNEFKCLCLKIRVLAQFSKFEFDYFPLYSSHATYLYGPLKFVQDTLRQAAIWILFNMKLLINWPSWIYLVRLLRKTLIMNSLDNAFVISLNKYGCGGVCPHPFKPLKTPLLEVVLFMLVSDSTLSKFWGIFYFLWLILSASTAKFGVFGIHCNKF